MSRDELLAGLRKLGYDSPERVRLAVLEETGAITAIERDGADGAVGAGPLGPPGVRVRTDDTAFGPDHAAPRG